MSRVKLIPFSDRSDQVPVSQIAILKGKRWVNKEGDKFFGFISN